MVGVLQAAGMAAVFGDEPCPICGEIHDDKVKLEESVDTKGACDDLIKHANKAVEEADAELKRRVKRANQQVQADRDAKIKEQQDRINNADARVPPAVISKWKTALEALKSAPLPEAPPVSITAMAGVVKCKTCGHIHAGFSMEQYSDIQAKTTGWHCPTASTNILGDSPGKGTPGIDRFKVHVKGNEARFENRWQYCEKKREDYNSGLEPELHIPPGQCAGQQLVLHALDHGCRPIGLTERWYKSGSPGARYEGDVHVRDLGKDGIPGPRRPAKKAPGEFGGDDAVPPCGTCQVILAALLCPTHRAPECDYKKLPAEVCHKC